MIQNDGSPLWNINTVTLILFLQTYVLIVTECIPLFFNQLGIRKLKHFPKGRWFLVSTMSSLTSSLTVPVLGSMPCNKAIKEKSFWNEIELLTCLTSVTVEFRTLIVMSWMNFSAGVVTRSNSCSAIVSSASWKKYSIRKFLTKLSIWSHLGRHHCGYYKTSRPPGIQSDYNAPYNSSRCTLFCLWTHDSSKLPNHMPLC